MSLTQELKKKAFEDLWQKYPNKDGKKQAWACYNNSIKTYQDIQKITAALDNYISHLKQEDWKKPKNGSTWFNNWRDWIKEFTANELVKSSKPIPLTPDRIKQIKYKFTDKGQQEIKNKFTQAWEQTKKKGRE